jgi:hypothetical protein
VRRSAPKAEMVLAIVERTATVAIVTMTRSADGTAMIQVIRAVIDTTAGLHLVGTDPDLLLRVIDTADTGASVNVSTVMTSAGVTTAIGGVIGIVAETVATTRIRESHTPDRTATTDVTGTVKGTALRDDTRVLLVRLETAMIVLLPPMTAAEISPAVSLTTDGILAAITVHLLLVPQPTGLIPRQSKKNDAASWQICKIMPPIWR